MSAGGKNATSFILKGIGRGTFHHNIPAKNAQRKKNKISTILLIYVTGNICDKMCVVPNQETQKNANITAQIRSKIRSIIIFIPFKYFNRRPLFYSPQEKNHKKTQRPTPDSSAIKISRINYSYNTDKN